MISRSPARRRPGPSRGHQKSGFSRLASRWVIFPAQVYGRFWSFLVISGHFWPFLVIFTTGFRFCRLVWCPSGRASRPVFGACLLAVAPPGHMPPEPSFLTKNLDRPKTSRSPDLMISRYHDLMISRSHDLMISRPQDLMIS